MRRTYITVDNEVKEYEYNVKLWKRIKRPRCQVCSKGLISIYTRRNSEHYRLGYYCPMCGLILIDKTKGKVFLTNIEEGGIK